MGCNISRMEMDQTGLGPRYTIKTWRRSKRRQPTTNVYSYEQQEIQRNAHDRVETGSVGVQTSPEEQGTIEEDKQQKHPLPSLSQSVERSEEEEEEKKREREGKRKKRKTEKGKKDTSFIDNLRSDELRSLLRQLYPAKGCVLWKLDADTDDFRYEGDLAGISGIPIEMLGTSWREFQRTFVEEDGLSLRAEVLDAIRDTSGFSFEGRVGSDSETEGRADRMLVRGHGVKSGTGRGVRAVGVIYAKRTRGQVTMEDTSKQQSARKGRKKKESKKGSKKDTVSEKTKGMGDCGALCHEVRNAVHGVTASIRLAYDALIRLRYGIESIEGHFQKRSLELGSSQQVVMSRSFSAPLCGAMQKHGFDFSTFAPNVPSKPTLSLLAPPNEQSAFKEQQSLGVNTLDTFKNLYDEFEAVLETLDDASEAANHQKVLLDNALMFEKLLSGKLDIEVSSFRPRDLLNRAAKIVRGSAVEKGLWLSVRSVPKEDVARVLQQEPTSFGYISVEDTSSMSSMQREESTQETGLHRLSLHAIDSEEVPNEQHTESAYEALSKDNSVPIVLSSEQIAMQILMNLLSNALKFTSKGGIDVCCHLKPLTVDDMGVLQERVEFLKGKKLLRLPKDFVKEIHCLLTLTVEDTGMGIPQEKFARIFRRFEQESRSTSASFGGSGLGLCLALELAQASLGSIAVESSVGKGTKFTVSLPAVLIGVVPEDTEPRGRWKRATLPPPRLQQTTTVSVFPGEREDLLRRRAEGKAEKLEREREVEREERTKQEKRRAHSSAIKGTVLVIEDERMNRKVMERYLRGLFLEPVCAVSGEEGLKTLDHRRQDVKALFLDLHLPGMDGFDVLNEVQKKEGETMKCGDSMVEKLPIIVISGDDQLETRQEALEAGADAFLQKPFSLEQVAQLLIHFGVL